jgi:ATP-dependent protease ClpP protease subunit
MSKKKLLRKIEDVFVTGEINVEIAAHLLAKLQSIREEGRIPRLNTHSFGGNGTAGLFIHDQLKLHFPNIVIIGSGTIQSIGLNIFLAAKKENRFITKNTSMFLHQTGIATKRGFISISNKKFKRLEKKEKEAVFILQDSSDKIILNETSLSRKKLHRLEKKETFLTPKKIIRYGIASKIISSLEEI